MNFLQNEFFTNLFNHKIEENFFECVAPISLYNQELLAAYL